MKMNKNITKIIGKMEKGKHYRATGSVGDMDGVELEGIYTRDVYHQPILVTAQGYHCSVHRGTMVETGREITHKVVDMIYHNDEAGHNAFHGSLEDCEIFVKDAQTFGLEIVPLTEEEKLNLIKE